jgi:DNA modification methylase
VQKRLFALADNKMPDNAGWDHDKLIIELGDLAELLPPLNWDLSLTGFEPAEIDSLFADLGPERPDIADAPAPADGFIVSKAGDLWLLGAHRLLCGSALATPDVDHLMSGGRAHMVFTDPPYNVQIARVQGRGRIKHSEFAYASGEMTERQYVDFLTQALGNAARCSTDGAVHFVFIDWRHIGELIAAARTVYTAMLNLCVWAKTNAGQGSFYRSQHELVGVFRVGEAPHANNVRLGRFGRNRSNLWSYAGVNGFGDQRHLLSLHPTVKPVSLIADAMRDCTSRTDIVLDPFVGSGSTIMAAEKIGRLRRRRDPALGGIHTGRSHSRRRRPHVCRNPLRAPCKRKGDRRALG